MLQFNALQEKFQGQGFVVLGFPSNTFTQEPGANSEILNCLADVRPGGGFTPNFPLFEVSPVNGAQRNPVFAHMTAKCPQESPEVVASLVSAGAGNPLWSPIRPNDISWNFVKMLVSKDGRMVRRYSPGTNPLAIVPDIEDLLRQDL